MIITFYPLLVDSRISLNIPEDPEQKMSKNSKLQEPSTQIYSDAFLNAISSSFFSADYLKRKMLKNMVELTEGQSKFIFNLKEILKKNSKNFQNLFNGTNGLFSNGLKTINFGQGFQTPLNLCIDKDLYTLEGFIEAYKNSVKSKVNIYNKDATYWEYWTTWSNKKLSSISNVIRLNEIAKHKLEVAINFIPGIYDELASRKNKKSAVRSMQTAKRPLCVSALGYALLTMQPIETIKYLINNGAEYHNVWDGDNQTFYKDEKYNNDVITFIFFLLKLKYDKKIKQIKNNQESTIFKKEYNFNAYLKYLTNNWNDVDGNNQQTTSTNKVQTISLWKKSNNILKYLLSLYHEKRNVNVLGHKTARAEEVLVKSFWAETIKTSALGLLMSLDKDINESNFIFTKLANNSSNTSSNINLISQLEKIISTNLNKNGRKYTPKLDPYKNTRLGAWSKNIQLKKMIIKHKLMIKIN